jgi:hypothetical protein
MGLLLALCAFAQDDVAALSDPTKAEAAAQRLVAQGAAAVRPLIGEAREGKDVSSRLWAIACLREIGDEAALEPLEAILGDGKEKELLRVAAAKAMLDISPERGVARVLRRVASLTSPGLASEVAKQVVGRGAAAYEALLDACFHDPDMQVRQTAASYLASFASDERMREAVIEALAYTSERAKSGVPWKGGPLFLPQAAWKPEQARRLSAALIHWMIWSEARSEAEAANQVRNNLWSVAQLAGIPVTNWQASGLEWARLFVRHTYGKGVDPGKSRPELVRFLVGALRETRRQEAEILDQLKAISGADVGNEPEAWERWLQQQR